MPDEELDSLEERGLILPEAARGELPMTSSMPGWQVIACGALAVGATALMAWGGGGGWTWLGGVLFVAALELFTALTTSAIERRDRLVEQVVHAARQNEGEGSAAPDAEGGADGGANGGEAGGDDAGGGGEEDENGG